MPKPATFILAKANPHGTLITAIKLWRAKAKREPDSPVARMLPHAEAIYIDAMADSDYGMVALMAVNLLNMYDAFHTKEEIDDVITHEETEIII